MMNNSVRRILKLASPIVDLAVTATGCFVFTRGFRLVALDEEESNTEPPMRVHGRATKLLPGVGPALFLLAFIVSEALTAIGALRH